MNMGEKVQIGIVGHGIIGASWALVFARAGHAVRIWARNEASEEHARQNVATIVEAIGGTGLEGDSSTLHRISYHRDAGNALGDAAYIQESTPEDLAVKRSVFAAIEKAARADALIGSSTSGILPSLLAQEMQHPERLLVVHPLTPPHLLPITELCAGERTSSLAVEQVAALLRAVGQHPVRIQKETPGFVINRLLGALLKECFALIESGAIQVSDVDALFTEGFGLRWSVIGPLAAMDLNAPGGIRDYLQRYGKLFEASPDLAEHIATRFEQDCAEGTREDRARRRDHAIASIARCKRTLDL